MLNGVEPGRGIVVVNLAGTVAFALTATVAAIALGPARYAGVAVSLALFSVGCVVFLWAYAIAVQRSREVEIGIGGLYFLAGDTAPRAVRRWMNAMLGVQVVVSLATASARPFTTLAFGVLAPLFGLGLNGLWGARHGTFGPRIVDHPRRARGAATDDPVPQDQADPASGRPMEQNADHG
jgi:hypothetical protein